MTGILEDAAAAPEIEGPKPIAVAISTDDVQALFAVGTNPYNFNQLILAKLKDAGAPVEGAIHLKMAHGSVFKLKDSAFQEQSDFQYLWLPENYIYALKHAPQGVVA